MKELLQYQADALQYVIGREVLFLIMAFKTPSITNYLVSLGLVNQI
jgi:hypothetical protein